MEVHGRVFNSATPSSEEEMDLRRGPWTVEEDIVLMNYIANHGEGRWNSLARCAGLKRTGKSCRLRWLNYLRPDVRRGNITPEEQLLILELHSRWGNRWSKIAQQLPGRTDNEIKNYWRTRVQKHAKQLQCDVNSKQFKDVMRYLWMPRLLERIRAASGGGMTDNSVAVPDTTTTTTYQHHHQLQALPNMSVGEHLLGVKPSPESCSMGGGTPSDSAATHVSSSSSMPVDDCWPDYCAMQGGTGGEIGGGASQGEQYVGWCPEALPSPGGYAHLGSLDFEQSEAPYENLWSLDDIWSLQHQL